MSIKRILVRAALAGLIVAAAPLGALADGDLLARTLTAFDKNRLFRFEQARTDAIGEARKSGAPADVAALERILAGEPLTIAGTDIRGRYRCRTVKLGGLAELTIYDWFACRIGEDDLGYRIDKTRGSQRFAGHFVDANDKWLIYYGADHYDYEQPGRYGADADRDGVGRFVKVGARRYRLELPLPKYESTFDIIEMEKR